MKAKKKYELSILGILFLFAYILATEVLERYTSTFDLYKELSLKESQLLSPEELSQKKADLQMQRAALARQLNAGSRSFDRNQLGIVRFLNESAEAERLQFRTLTPLQDVVAGQISETGFNVEFSATYHTIGKFINKLERGPLPIEIRKLVLEAQKPGSTVLKASLEAKARFLPKESI